MTQELPMVALPGGERVPALGQGTWHMGETRRRMAEEAAAVRLGIELGMTLIDTVLIVTATVRRSGRLVGVVDVDVANEAGQLLAIGRATYATAVR